MPDTLLIRNARVVTMDHARRVIDEGFVAVRGPVIDAVGPMSECPRDADQVIDASGSAALPGFVNAHAHSLDILLRGGVADDRPLYDWLVNVNLPAGARYRISDNDLAVRLFAAEALRSGITTVVDQMETPFDAWDDIADTVVATYGATGMRAVVCQMFYDTVPEHLAGLDLGGHTGRLADLLERIGGMIVRHHGSYDGRISFWPAPGLAVLCTAEAVLGAQRLARSHGVMTTIHVAESVHDRVQQGMSSITYLADIGYLADIRTLARTGTKVSTQPVSNLFLGNGIAPVAEMHTAGITVALGTDDGNCNNSVNMLADMKFAALLQKGRYRDAAALTAQRVLEMATIEGARAVGMADQIGSLEPGKRADVILIDMQAAHMLPHQSIASALVYQANGTEVHTAVIDGHVVMADRQPAWLSAEAERGLLDDVRAATARILSESGLWPRR
jgi:cytosine/adenosine deaminase-related metal-dependent hydrolase